MSVFLNESEEGKKKIIQSAKGTIEKMKADIAEYKEKLKTAETPNQRKALNLRIDEAREIIKTYEMAIRNASK